MRAVRILWALAVTFTLLLSVACARQPAPPSTAASTLDVRAKRVCGDRLIDVAVSDVPGGEVQAGLRLRSGEPTATEPFQLLESMALDYPRETVYTLTFTTPDPTADEPDAFVFGFYAWTPAEGTVEWGKTRATDSNFPEVGVIATASGVNRRTISAIGAGEASLPAFE